MAAEEKAEQAKTTLDFVKETLGERVKEVKLSDALGSHTGHAAKDKVVGEFEKVHTHRHDGNAQRDHCILLDIFNDLVLHGRLRVRIHKIYRSILLFCVPQPKQTGCTGNIVTRNAPGSRANSTHAVFYG